MNLWELLWDADLVVKLVMLILLVASLLSWAVILEKWFGFRMLNYRSKRFYDGFWSGGPLKDLYIRVNQHVNDPVTAIFVAGMREWQRALSSGATLEGQSFQELERRIERAMDAVGNRQIAALEKRMTLLASVGSSSPFIGLFGTVWGIMNSFLAIGAEQNTSLAVVAPGIAEALFATAMGLVAAIPATIFYNKFIGDMDQMGSNMANFQSEFLSVIARQNDSNTNNMMHVHVDAT